MKIKKTNNSVLITQDGMRLEMIKGLHGDLYLLFNSTNYDNVITVKKDDYGYKYFAKLFGDKNEVRFHSADNEACTCIAKRNDDKITLEFVGNFGYIEIRLLNSGIHARMFNVYETILVSDARSILPNITKTINDKSVIYKFK